VRIVRLFFPRRFFLQPSSVPGFLIFCFSLPFFAPEPRFIRPFVSKLARTSGPTQLAESQALLLFPSFSLFFRSLAPVIFESSAEPSELVVVAEHGTSGRLPGILFSPPFSAQAHSFAPLRCEGPLVPPRKRL